MMDGALVHFHAVIKGQNLATTTGPLPGPFLPVEPEQNKSLDDRAGHLPEVQNERMRHREPFAIEQRDICLLYTSPSPRDRQKSRMPSSA